MLYLECGNYSKYSDYSVFWSPGSSPGPHQLTPHQQVERAHWVQADTAKQGIRSNTEGSSYPEIFIFSAPTNVYKSDVLSNVHKNVYCSPSAYVLIAELSLDLTLAERRCYAVRTHSTMLISTVLISTMLISAVLISTVLIFAVLIFAVWSALICCDVGNSGDAAARHTQICDGQLWFQWNISVGRECS